MTTHQEPSEAQRPQPCCPYCSKPIDTPHISKIIDRGWDPVRRKQFVRTREMQFCSSSCASSYQMGCEG